MGSIHSIPEAGFIAPHSAGTIAHARSWCHATRNLVTPPTLASEAAIVREIRPAICTSAGGRRP